MPANTGSPFNLQYPLSSDPVNVHGDIQALAEDVAAALNGVAFKNNSNTFAATNIFSASSADPIITVTQSGAGAAISTTGKIIAGEFELSGGTSSQFLKADGSTDSNSYSLSNHAHGNITNAGAIGTTANLVIGTTTSGVLTNFTSAAPTSESTQFLRGDGTWVVPSDTNTTYTFTSGTTNGAFSVTPLGGSAESVSIFGLGSAAYTESSAYATAGHNHDLAYQPLDTDLTEISALNASSGSTGLLKRNTNNTYSLDTTAYLTGNQTITLSGAISGSGTTTITTTLAAHATSHEASGSDELKGNLRLDSTLISGATTLSKTTHPNGLNRMHRVSGTFTLSLPQNSASDYDIGSQLNFLQTGAGTITFAAGTGATVVFNASRNKMNAIGAVATAIKTDTNTWYVFGNVSA